MDDKPVRILSIDGGGIRGIISALLIAEIEKRAKKQIHELFDLIIGTSTGGVISLCITMADSGGKKAKYSGTDVVAIYEKYGEEIFSKSLLRSIRSLNNLIDQKYSAYPLEEVLKQYFGDNRFKDTLKDTVITSYDIERRMPFFFKSYKAKVLLSYDFFIRDIARATTAAPTYFEPHKINIDNSSDYYALIDGGVYANNPSMCGYVEALSLYPEKRDFIVVSLGTGQVTKRYQYDKAKNWGLVEWAQPILDIVFDGISDTVHYQLNELLNGNFSMPKYFRFQPILENMPVSLDDASTEYIRNLKLIADNMIYENNNLIDVMINTVLS